MSCNAIVWINCSSSVNTWGINDPTGSTIWSTNGSFCGSTNSHSIQNGYTVWARPSGSFITGSIIGFAEVINIFTTGSCFKSASLIAQVAGRDNWIINYTCGSTSSCSGTSITASFVQS